MISLNVSHVVSLISEFEFVKNTQNSKRLFLYKQSKDSKICKLNLEGLDDILVLLSGNKKTLDLFDKVVKDVGYGVKDWLPVFKKRYGEGCV